MITSVDNNGWLKRSVGHTASLNAVRLMEPNLPYISDPISMAQKDTIIVKLVICSILENYR